MPEAFAPPTSPHAIEVVAGLIWRGSELLAAQRLPRGRCAGLWEFPGGKREAGEPLAETLGREAREELGVALHVGALAWQLVHPGENDEPPLALYFFHATVVGARAPRPLCSQQLRWARPQDLTKLPFCPADAPLVRALATGAIAPWAPSEGPAATNERAASEGGGRA